MLPSGRGTNGRVIGARGYLVHGRGISTALRPSKAFLLNYSFARLQHQYSLIERLYFALHYETTKVKQRIPDHKHGPECGGIATIDRWLKAVAGLA